MPIMLIGNAKAVGDLGKAIGPMTEMRRNLFV